MSSLKDIRNRKKSILATHKITSAMKMIAAVKLRKAQQAVEKARPYARLMANLLDEVFLPNDDLQGMHPLFYGNGKSSVHLFVIATSNRGLCGSFNTSIARHALYLREKEKNQGRNVRFLCWGSKGYEQLHRSCGTDVLDVIPALGTPYFSDAVQLSQRLQEMFSQGLFDLCTIVFNGFISALSQEILTHQLIPFLSLNNDFLPQEKDIFMGLKSPLSLYDYEPSKEKVLGALLPKNLSVQLFRAMLESAASEQGARMTSMEAATRNAEEMMGLLDLKYNRTRQALITTELIEIIAGAESL